MRGEEFPPKTAFERAVEDQIRGLERDRLDIVVDINSRRATLDMITRRVRSEERSTRHGPPRPSGGR